MAQWILGKILEKQNDVITVEKIAPEQFEVLHYGALAILKKK